MSNTDAILEFLEAAHEPCCDDCISRGANVKPRQQVYAICRRLADEETITRGEGTCAHCRKHKLVNRGLDRMPQEQVIAIPAERPSVTSEALRKQPLSIEALRNHLDRFCRALQGPHDGGPGTGLAAVISKLRDRGIVPGHQANMMHTIIGLRNVFVHDHIEMRQSELAVAKAAWAIIAEWAERHEPEKWRLTTR